MAGLQKYSSQEYLHSGAEMDSLKVRNNPIMLPGPQEAREGERSGNWSREKMVEEWRGRHHWMEQSRNSSDQLSSSSRAWSLPGRAEKEARFFVHLW